MLKKTAFACKACRGTGHVLRYRGEDLRAARLRAGFSLRAFARNAGTSAAFICDVELNRRNCPERIATRYRRLPRRSVIVHTSARASRTLR